MAMTHMHSFSSSVRHSHHQPHLHLPRGAEDVLLVAAEARLKSGHSSWLGTTCMICIKDKSATGRWGRVETALDFMPTALMQNPSLQIYCLFLKLAGDRLM